MCVLRDVCNVEYVDSLRCVMLYMRIDVCVYWVGWYSSCVYCVMCVLLYRCMMFMCVALYVYCLMCVLFYMCIVLYEYCFICVLC